MIPAIIAGAAAMAPTIMSIGSKVGKGLSKNYGKYGNTPIGQASQFGLGYGAMTNVGYNLSNEGLTKQWRTQYPSGKISSYELNPMYGRNYNNGYARYNGYYSNRGKIRVWSKKYRRYIWVYPRRRY